MSIVIPTRNRPKLLLRALLSILSQGINNVEVVIVDSSDGKYKLLNTKIIKSLRMYQIEFKHVYIPPTSPSKARNVGIYHSQGEYIAFLDDDDYWLPNKLLTQLRLIKNGYNFIATGCVIMLDEPRRRKVKGIRIPKIMNPYEDILKTNFIATSTVVVKKYLLLKAGCFNEELYNLEDWDCWIRLLKLPDTRFHLIPAPLVVISHYPYYSTGKSKRLSESILKFLMYHLKELDKDTVPLLLLRAYEHLIVEAQRSKDLERIIYSLRPKSLLLRIRIAIHRILLYPKLSSLLRILWLVNDRSYGFIQRLISLLII